MSLNKVMLIGNVGADPEINHLDNNLVVARIRLATSETYKNKNGEKVTNTEWHSITLWRGLADVVSKYVKKGSQIYVEGRIRTRSWDDKDGNKRYTTEIVADNMVLLGRRSDAGSEGGSSLPQSSHQDGTPNTSPVPDFEETDDLPF